MPRQKVITLTKPTYAGLAIDVTCELSPGPRKRVDAFHADCIDFEWQATALHTDRSGLLDGAMDAAMKDLIEAGQELEVRRRELEAELLELRWRRREILPDLLGDYQRAAESAIADYTQTLEETMAAMRDSGAVHGIPTVGTPAAAVPDRFMPGTKAQVRHAARQQMPVMQAAGRMNLAKAAVNTLKSLMEQVPTLAACRIEWEPAKPQDALAEQVLRATAPAERSNEWSENTGRIRDVLGFERIALNAVTRRTLEELGDTVPMLKGLRPSLTGHGKELSQRILRLLQTLPQTGEVSGCVRWLKDDLREHGASTIAADRPRTHYMERETGKIVA